MKINYNIPTEILQAIESFKMILEPLEKIQELVQKWYEPFTTFITSTQKSMKELSLVPGEIRIDLPFPRRKTNVVNLLIIVEIRKPNKRGITQKPLIFLSLLDNLFYIKSHLFKE